jgi:S-DNA-T family DNA segregation ATPase FtsK/SpoIIIE
MSKKKASPRSQKAQGTTAPSRSSGQRGSAAKPTLDERLVEFAAPRRRELAGALVILLGLLSLLALGGIPLPGLSSWWKKALQQAFGWGSWIVALSLGFGGVHLFLRPEKRPWRITPAQVIGFEVVFVASLALSHLTSARQSDASLALAISGRGGGYIGWALSVPLVDGVGMLLAWSILAAVWLFGTALLFRVSWRDVQRRILDLSAGMQEWAGTIGRQQRPSSRVPSPQPPAGRPAAATSRPAERQLPRQPALPQPAPRPHELVIARPASHTGRPPDRSPELPPLSLLEPGQTVQQSEEEIKEKAALIEETLLDFGLPVQVVEVRRGPAVTQFGVAPQYIEKPTADGGMREQKVRVSQITALTNDLALALAAPSLRLEAPVPGRPIVGIEVPNEETALVHLRPVLQSPQFYGLKTPLCIGLGLDVSGATVAADLASMPHLLIAGTTGSGKSVCINALTTCLVCNNTPEDLRLVMVDPKMVELVRFNGLPHLLGRVEVDLERIIGVLRWLAREMDERYKILASAGARTLSDYNKLARRRKKWDPLPFIVLLIDELSDLMMMAPEEVEQTLVRLAQMSRAVGIHLVVATQRPSTDVVTGLIKANFPARIAFAVATSIDSRVVLDGGGAETLLGKGDMLFQAPDAPKPVRLQGCFVSDLEIERVVSFWRKKVGTEGKSVDSVAPWDELLARQAVIQEKDSLLEEAIALAQENEAISTSFIQRRLRIGYPRAARLMDALEEMGVVGEGQQGGRSRDVLVSSEDDPLSDYLESESS